MPSKQIHVTLQLEAPQLQEVVYKINSMPSNQIQVLMQIVPAELVED